MSSIVGISGKKQSGKTSCGNFLFGSAMLSIGLVEYALIVPFDFVDETRASIFPVDSMNPTMIDFMAENIWSEVKVYNFADNLKRICIDVLGLTERQCYGTEEEKSSNTNFDWSNMVLYGSKKSSAKMTAREVMQYVGTDFFRRIYPQVWVDSTIRKVIRLTRNIFGDSDQHPSETALDNYEGFDFVLDNQEMSLKEQNEAVYNKLVDWDFVDYKAVATPLK